MTKILAVSDEESQFIYHAIGGDRFKDVNFMISCGDLPYFYLEYIISMSNKDLYYVKGNHAHKEEISDHHQSSGPQGGRNLHLKSMRTPEGILLAGIEGSILYNRGPHQYTQGEMWQMVFRLVPHLFLNFLQYNRYLDIFVTHAPPWKINDQQDLPHQGIKAFRWLLEVFHPRYHLHGHTHDYLNRSGIKTRYLQTDVINVTGYQIIEF